MALKEDKFEVVARPTSFFFTLKLPVALSVLLSVKGFYPAKSLDLNPKQMSADSNSASKLTCPLFSF
jgi:hypothetical protein